MDKPSATRESPVDVLQQARDVIQSYEREEPYVNGRFATTTEIILAREVLRLNGMAS